MLSGISRDPQVKHQNPAETDSAAYLLRALQLRRERSWVGPQIIWNPNGAPLLGPDRSESAYQQLRSVGE